MEKTTLKKIGNILAIALMIGIFTAGLAICFEPRPDVPWDTGMSPSHHPPIPPPLPLGMKLLLDAQVVNVISQLTGESAETIKQQLACKPVPDLLEDKGISLEAFHSTMNEQSLKLVKQAAAGGIITKQQADDIQKAVNKRIAGLQSHCSEKGK